MAKLKTEWEIKNGVKFSKRGIVDYIERFLATESINSEDPQTAKAWEEKLKTPGLTYYLKKGGSDINTSQPFFRSEVSLPQAFKLNKVIKCVSVIIFYFTTLFQIYFPENATKWDKNVKDYEQIPLEKGNTCYGMTYVSQKKTFTIDSRDFLDKGFSFFYKGKFYRYSCSVNNNLDLKPKPKDTVRGATLYNCVVMYRDPKDLRIYYTVVTQCDYKLNIPTFILTSFLPKAAKSWIGEI